MRFVLQNLDAALVAVAVDIVAAVSSSVVQVRVVQVQGVLAMRLD